MTEISITKIVKSLMPQIKTKIFDSLREQRV